MGTTHWRMAENNWREIVVYSREEVECYRKEWDLEDEARCMGSGRAVVVDLQMDLTHGVQVQDCGMPVCAWYVQLW